MVTLTVSIQYNHSLAQLVTSLENGKLDSMVEKV